MTKKKNNSNIGPSSVEYDNKIKFLFSNQKKMTANNRFFVS